MGRRDSYLALVLWALYLFPFSTVWSQAPPQSASQARLPKVGKVEWDISGHVTTIRGDPVRGATVQVDIGAGPEFVKTIDTNLRGDFTAEYYLDPIPDKKLSVQVAATKDGYFDSRESAAFDSPEKAPKVELVLRERPEDIHQLSAAALIAGLAPGLRAPTTVNALAAPTREAYEQGARQLIDEKNPGASVALQSKACESEPACLECHTLLGLALLARGSWSSAMREFIRAASLNESRQGKAQRPEPLIILGVLEAWRGRPEESEALLRRALEIDPGNMLSLQEAGRAAIFDRNMIDANHCLEKAIRAGASSDAHYLRARALLGLGDAKQAAAEMQAYLGGREVREVPLALRAEWSEMVARLQLESEGRAQSRVELSITELLKEVPELNGLQSAPDQEPLSQILQKVGEGVQTFLANFPNTISIEEVRQERLQADGKVQGSIYQEFQYLLLDRQGAFGVGLEEYRTNAAGLPMQPDGLRGRFMVTAGFASHALHFLPANQPGSAFRYLGRQAMDGHETYVIAFAQRPETAQVLEAVRINDVSRLVLVQGVAWIDANNYQIIRMRTDLLKPPVDMGLKRQTTNIHFGEVRFSGNSSKLWLPREVGVTVELKTKIFRNWHRYSDFKFFNVEARDRRNNLEPASDPSGSKSY